MLKTPNYNLNKPEYSDVADVSIAVGDNMDILDEEMKKISDGSSTIYPTTNIGNRYFATIPTFTLQEGFPFALKFNAASSSNITININNGGDKNVFDYFNNRVNNVRKDLIANFRYDSVNLNFQLLGKGGGGNALPSQVLKDVTYTANSGPGVGIIPSKGTQIFTPGTIDQTIAAGQYLSRPQVISGDTDLLSPNIVAGINLFGVPGSATIESLGGKRFASGSTSMMVSDANGAGGGLRGGKTIDISQFVSFVPKTIICSIVGTGLVAITDLNSGYLMAPGYYEPRNGTGVYELYHSEAITNIDLTKVVVTISGIESIPLGDGTYTINWYAYS